MKSKIKEVIQQLIKTIGFMSLLLLKKKILDDIKDCIPNLSLSVVSVLSEMFGYSVGCKRKITELEDRITELEEKLNSKNSD